MSNTNFVRLLPSVLLLSFLFSACSSSTILNGGNWQASSLQRRNIRALTVDQNHPNMLYAGDAQGQLFFTNDGGLHWSERISGLTAANPIHALAMDSVGKKVYAATDRGLYVSSDAAQHWRSLASAPGLPADSVTALEFDPDAGNDVYIATAHHGFSVSLDGGASWKTASSGLPVNAPVNKLTFDATTRILWAATRSGIYRTANKGEQWQAANTGLPANISVNSVQSAAASGGSKGLLFAGTNEGFFRSQDGGGHWSRGHVPLVGTVVHDVLVDFRSANATTIFVATDAGAFRSDDSGQNWNSVAAGIPRGTPVYTLALGSDNFSQLYAVAGGIYLFPGVTGGVTPSRIFLILIIVVFFYLLFRFTHRNRRGGRQRSAQHHNPPEPQSSPAPSSTPES